MVSHNILVSKMGHCSVDGWITVSEKWLDHWTTWKPGVSVILHGSIRELILFNTIYHTEEEVEHIFVDFFEDTMLVCAVDLSKGSTQGRQQTGVPERAGLVFRD